jgi:ribose 5-phosphate isomerase A
VSAEEHKRATGEAALRFVEPGQLVGVGTGSTVNYFIEALAAQRDRIAGAVSSSEASTERLRHHGITVHDLNEVEHLPVYIDGADEITSRYEMIKGGGGALTREKIVAAVARSFVCIVDGSKCVDQLGAFPLPVEVIPMARRHVAGELARLGGEPVLRDGTTDNGNLILDIHGLAIPEPSELEQRINNIPGVVTVGIFAQRRADRLIVGGPDGVTVDGP